MYGKFFQVNDLSNIKVEHFNGSQIYTMDNFYKYPEDVLSILLTVKEPELWKKEDTLSYNGVYFADYRHKFDVEEFRSVGNRLAEICGQHSPAPSTIKTNCLKLFDKQFNDYKNNYWAPHLDAGYNAIIYLNTVPTATNLYEQLEDDPWTTPEHYEPWRKKSKYKIIKQLEGKFNRLIMFDGAKFLHGMDISNDDFFNIHRINQVLFFR
jgi:hypothetical protein